MFSTCALRDVTMALTSVIVLHSLFYTLSVYSGFSAKMRRTLNSWDLSGLATFFYYLFYRRAEFSSQHVSHYVLYYIGRACIGEDADPGRVLKIMRGFWRNRKWSTDLNAPEQYGVGPRFDSLFNERRYSRRIFYRPDVLVNCPFASP